MSEWQPIETAPKDGTPILLWLHDDDICFRASWGLERASLYDPQASDFYGWRIEEMGTALKEEDLAVHQITQWMPVPEGAS